MHKEAQGCVRALLRRKETLNIVPQILFEFWVVATRPAASNGLGLSVEGALRIIRKAETFFHLLHDPVGIYREWLRLVETYAVSGVTAHDARIVAAMKLHGISHLVTFNGADFKRYHGDGITVVTPAEILRASPVRT
jgi:predicted nucleic acid-binding protein